MYTEKRKEERSALAMQPHGMLHVAAGAQGRRIARVQDVSLSGVRLLLDEPVVAGEGLQIHYQASSIDLRLNGTVAWSMEMLDEEEGRVGDCIAGVRLDSPALLQALW